jgi:hypothetical protein
MKLPMTMFWVVTPRGLAVDTISEMEAVPTYMSTRRLREVPDMHAQAPKIKPEDSHLPKCLFAACGL